MRKNRKKKKVKAAVRAAIASSKPVSRIQQAMTAMSSKFTGIRPRSKLLRNAFRNAGMKNYSERVARAPAAQQTSYSIGAAQFNRGRPIIISHREYLQPIVVAPFTGAGRYIVQPGLVDNFPWLGQIAGAFENYRFKRLNYVYRSRAGSNTAITVYTAFQYDVTDPEFTSVEDMMTYAGARSEVAWRDFSVNALLNRGRMMRKFLTRTDVLATGQDAQLYDSALFTINCISATTSAGFYAGDLLVEYEIELWNPKQNPNLLGAYGVDAEMVAPLSGATWGSAPLAGYNAGKSVYFPTSSEPVVDEVKGEIMFPAAGSYDVSYHLHQFGAGTFSVSSMAWTLPDPTAGILTELQTIGNNGTVTTAIKLTVLLASCILKVTASGTGTAAQAASGWLAIAVEAANFVLNFQSKSPSLVMHPECFENLKRRYPKRDLSSFENAVHRWRRREVKRQIEYRLEPQESENDSDGFERAIIAAPIIEKRSKSSERKSEKKG